jgi:hypothetical protein
MSDLGPRTKEGVKLTTNKILPGAWVVTFPAIDMPRDPYEVYHGALTGPGGYAQVYLDETLEDIIENGHISAFDPNIATYVRPGQVITIHWSTASGTAPKVTLKIRTPEAGRI